MPELPEVETIRRNLLPLIRGKRISRVNILSPVIVKGGIAPAELVRRTRNRIIAGVKRRGKSLLMVLDSSDVIMFRLGMTGQMLWSHPRRPVRKDKHTHVIIYVGGGERILFRDARRFGGIFLARAHEIERMLGMGPEPLHRRFTPGTLESIIGSRMRIKQLLMDQKRIAGIGNIYADEILFEAGIHPLTPACTLGNKQVFNLHKAVCSILREAIACQGDTFSDYRTAHGESGSYQDNHRVYQRHGEPCRRCATPIVRIRLGGRSCHFCPACQK